MIVPMKKVSLIVLDSEKEQALKILRKLGLVHVEITQGAGPRLSRLKEQIALLESGTFTVAERVEKTTEPREADLAQCLELAAKIDALTEETKVCYADIAAQKAEVERLKAWGEIDPAELDALAAQGIALALREMPAAEYEKLDESVRTILLGRTKNTVRIALVQTGASDPDIPDPTAPYGVSLPGLSTSALKQRIADQEQRLRAIDAELNSYAGYVQSMKQAAAELQKELQFETYATGMAGEALSEVQSVAVAWLNGYIAAEDLDTLKATAKEHAWGLAAEDPTAEDDVPTKLKNNKFVSLIYPLTDFLGTVPGYFEYDISGWFLGFIMVFFGIIFGDGGYGLLICGVAAALIWKAKAAKKPVAPMFWLILLLGGATVLWGLLTCTWFGLAPEQLPQWLQKLSLPVISNVNADRLWYPPWTNGEVGLTTAQNVQIFCFSLALVQLTVAHVKGMIRNAGSLKLLGDLGSILQLLGIFYVVLSLVVNGQVFPLGLVIGGIPVGTVAIALVGVGFAMSFVFANYEGSIGASILDSVKNIVSVLLGVVNVFSDIVSYIRLWAVGLAGAAISATVNELASPLLGNLMLIVLAVILLVFGHGLNMILNVLSVIVHGVRLNTLEFSTHLDMSWSGHKFEPFEE